VIDGSPGGTPPPHHGDEKRATPPFQGFVGNSIKARDAGRAVCLAGEVPGEEAGRRVRGRTRARGHGALPPAATSRERGTPLLTLGGWPLLPYLGEREYSGQVQACLNAPWTACTKQSGLDRDKMPGLPGTSRTLPKELTQPERNAQGG